MYYFAPNTIVQANKNIENLDSKTGGLFCILYCLSKHIEENISYTIDGEKLRRQLSFVFDKSPKDTFENARPSYIIFAKEWPATFFKNVIKNKVDLLSCAVFFLRRFGFENKPTEEEITDLFIKSYNLADYKDYWFCDGNVSLNIEYNQLDVEDNQATFYRMMSYVDGFKSILFRNVIQKSAADIKAAGQIQTLYSGSGIQTCFLLSDESLNPYYVMSNSETSKTLTTDSEDLYDDISGHNIFGIHMKNKNDALSDTNPHICIGWSALGNLTEVKDKETIEALHQKAYPDSKGMSQNVPQIWMFLKEMGKGDYIIFADEGVCHIGRIESDYIYDNSVRPGQDEDYVNNRKVKWLLKNVKRGDIDPELHSSLKSGRSLWRLDKHSSIVADLLFGGNAEDDTNNNTEKKDMLTCLDIELKPREEKVYPLNFIVYGAPGTGKTYSMVEYSLAIIDGVPIEEFRNNNRDRKSNVERYKSLVKDGQIVFTTFHQNYGYEEFIQGLRPDKESETMAFKVVDGVFKTIADRALNDEWDNNYVIIIDEINRANISKVFGELITLIEEDKRWGEFNEMSATLQSGDPFAVPNNLYIVGTMNSADKSISLIDAALRRRFDFIEQKPDSSLLKDSVLKAVLETINLKLVKDLGSTDLLVGHSYFINKSENDLPNILNNNIIPLLYEYYYDERKKVRNLLEEAIKESKANIAIVDEEVGRLRVKGE